MHATKTLSLTKRLSSAFTLIELLVVISIIALLIGILLPALGAARKTAMNIQCKSGMRQFTIAMLAYSVDNNSRFPTELGVDPNSQETGKFRERYWYSEPVIGSYVPGDVQPIDGNSYGGGIFRCPSDVDDARRSYSINIFSTSAPDLFGYPNLNNDNAFTADARNASEVILFADVYSPWWNDADGGGWYSSPFFGHVSPNDRYVGIGYNGGRLANSGVESIADYDRHSGIDQFEWEGGTCNWSFVDGHVANHGPSDLIDTSTRQSLYDIYWYPNERSVEGP
ncbi:prepilin-type N-terminal cleavage/methylation domain-containing protein [Planctomycetota bacterium]|nr:prepilin-type N-terminal cleavage/methylation domain-containing protein [Planctomycetota bacterium]